VIDCFCQLILSSLFIRTNEVSIFFDGGLRKTSKEEEVQESGRPKGKAGYQTEKAGRQEVEENEMTREEIPPINSEKAGFYSA
jgi:hypothetical protein